jgi:hypothetical protein
MKRRTPPANADEQNPISYMGAALLLRVNDPEIMDRLVVARKEGRPEAVIFTTFSGFRPDLRPRFMTLTEVEVEFSVPATFWDASVEDSDIVMIHIRDGSPSFSWVYALG